jgi:hypothetical protein
MKHIIGKLKVKVCAVNRTEIRNENGNTVLVMSMSQDPNIAQDVVTACNVHDQLIKALQIAKSFMTGFEGDSLQEGIDTDLATISAALTAAGVA